MSTIVKIIFIPIAGWGGVKLIESGTTWGTIIGVIPILGSIATIISLFL